MMNLPETQVARVAECHLKQKAGYGQDASYLKQHAITYTNSNSNIAYVLWKLKNRGLQECTLSNIRKALTFLAKHTMLDSPEYIQSFIANFTANNSYKRNLCYAYDCYAKINQLPWTKPKYYVNRRLPRIPSLEKINMIIANSSKKTALAISISFS